jgi:hypothetical protein
MVDPLLVKDILISVAFAFMLAGLCGLIVPIFPGLTVIWLAALGYGVFAGFGTLGWIAFVLITLLMLAGSFVDNILMGSRALQGGATWWTLACGWAGGILGSILLPPLGGIPGALVGVFLYDFLTHNDWRRSLTLTKGVALGCGWAFVIRFCMGVVMIALWVFWAFRGLPNN